MALIMEGIVYTMIFNLYNPFIQMFAKRMGGNDLHTALLNAAPPLVAIFMLIPCGILIERINKKKRTVLHLLCIVSLFYAAIAFVPMIPHEGKVMAFVVLIGLMNWPGALYLTTWQSYFADNFHGSYASRVYTVRSRISALFGLLTVLVTGILLTYIPKSDGERLVLYQIFYGVCFLLTIVQITFFSRVKSRKLHHAGTTEREKHDVKPSGMSLKDTFTRMVKNKKYMVFCICGFVFHFSWQMAWPLFFIYNSDYMFLNEFQFGLINVASGGAQFLSLTLWNKLIEKKGSSMVLIFGAIGLAMLPLFYTTKMSFPMLILMNILSGTFLAGFNLTLFLSLLDTLPKEKNTVYISVFNTLTSITGFIAPMTGLWLFNRTGIFTAMAIAGIVRIIGSMLYYLRWQKSKTGRQPEVASNLPE
jgi:MFS family permease